MIRKSILRGENAHRWNGWNLPKFTTFFFYILPPTSSPSTKILFECLSWYFSRCDRNVYDTSIVTATQAIHSYTFIVYNNIETKTWCYHVISHDITNLNNKISIFFFRTSLQLSFLSLCGPQLVTVLTFDTHKRWFEIRCVRRTADRLWHSV